MKPEDGAGLREKSAEVEIETSLKLELGILVEKYVVLMTMTMMTKMLLYAY